MLSHSLTNLEIRCLALVANGKPAARIRASVGVSEREVAILLFCAQRKLGAANRMHAVAKGISQGLIAI
jgi:LuxR family transcriptional activator of bioluminescence operon